MSRPHTRFYLVMAFALSIITVWGFSQTYFAPLLLNKPSAFGGQISDLPWIVHVHGWSFFLWYLLLVFQASLINRSNIRLHRRTGAFSIGLVVIMVITGLIIIPINIHLTLEPGSPPVWRLFGLVILSTLFLFSVFYALALKNRKRPQYHKRFMLVASAAPLGAAVFRVFLSVFGPNQWNIPAGILATNLILVAGILNDRRTHGRVHPVYWVGLSACLITETLFFYLPHSPVGAVVLEALATIGGKLLFLYV